MNIILPFPNTTHTTFDSLSSKDNAIPFEDKSSSVHLDGVLNRHQDIPAMRVIPRTPTFVPHYGVLTKTLEQLQITDSIFFTEKKKNIIIDGIFTKILYSTAYFTMAGLYIHFQLCSKFSTDGLSPHDNKSSKDNATHKTYIQFNSSTESNKFQIESICEIETKILQLYSQTQLIHQTKNPVYGLKTQLYSGSIRSHSEYINSGADEEDYNIHQKPTALLDGSRKTERDSYHVSGVRPLERRICVGGRGIDCVLTTGKGASGWRLETPSRLTSEDLYSQVNVLTKYIKISGVWETGLSYGITYKVFT